MVALSYTPLIYHMTQRVEFGKLSGVVPEPDLLALQLQSFRDFFQMENFAYEKDRSVLYRIFQEHFPISDSSGTFVLEFIDFMLETPRYTPQECIERAATYAMPLEAQLRLICNDEDGKKVTEEQVFLGDIPCMTPQGSFIVKGVERVIVSQIHRSYNVFFTNIKHASGAKLYSAKIIPARGTWLELVSDINNVVYVYLNQKKKYPVTLLLRALGYSSDKDILDLFGLGEEVAASKEELKGHLGRRLAGRVLRQWVEEFVDEETGEIISLPRSEVVLERDSIIDKETIRTILDAEPEKIVLQHPEGNKHFYQLIQNTFHKDTTNSTREALEAIYRQMRNTEPPDEQSARELVNQLLFSVQRSFLGKVGRYAINKKLGLNVPLDTYNITLEDIIATVRHFLMFMDGQIAPDDIDHLSNRRVKVVGEQLYDLFSTSIARMVRTIREKMNTRSDEDFTPGDLVSARIISSVVDGFFGSNPLAQYMDQVNPLGEVAHKRRLSSLGVGGLSREHAGVEVRDVHQSHYAKICVIETPEGLNIGLISSLALYAELDEMGFIKTPYCVVEKGVVRGNKIVSLTAEEEPDQVIAQMSPVGSDNKLQGEKIKARKGGEFSLFRPEEVQYMDVASNQIISVSAAMIPFLEHDDAGRGLMGANMQRQAVPLVKPEAPIVGTGIEARVVRDFRGIPAAERDGVVRYVDARKIVVEYPWQAGEEALSLEDNVRTYELKKFESTNRGTVINLQPAVLVGQKVKAGQLLCDGYATADGELALGRNLRVAFLSWQGYTFDDGIVVSERVVREDLFTSVHIKEVSMDLNETKLGHQEFTPDNPGLSEEAARKLDENGIISVGQIVGPGDVLASGIEPQAVVDLPPEVLFLQAIFGKESSLVRDISLKASPSIEGTVIRTRLFSRVERSAALREQRAQDLATLEEEASRKFSTLRDKAAGKLSSLLAGKVCTGIADSAGRPLVKKGAVITTSMLEEVIFDPAQGEKLLDKALPLAHLSFADWTQETDTNRAVRTLLLSYKRQYNHLLSVYKKDRMRLKVGDELPPGVLKRAKVTIAKRRKLKVGDKMANRHGNKGVVAQVVRQEDMPFFADGTPVDIILNPLGIPSRMNLGQLFEAILGAAGLALGKRYAVRAFGGATLEDIQKECTKAGVPLFGRTQLYDGLTGEAFDQKVTTGVMLMMKLDHLVDDKWHARSTGPNSLVTHQPLAGRAQFGGQRLGEMEVWALEAHGAAFTLSEMLTVKSDDLEGKRQTIECIIRNGPLPSTVGLPETFLVLVQEMRGLGLDVVIRRRSGGELKI